MKQHTTVQSSVGLVADTAQEFALNLIPQGETDLTREGAEAQLVSIAVRFSLNASAAVTTTAGATRILIFIDTDPRGALPAATSYLTSDDILSAYNTGRAIGQERNRGRFKFLYDETFDMVARPVASADSVPQTIHGKFYTKLKDIRTMYTGDTGAITEVEEASLIFAAIAGENVQNNTMQFNAVCRFTAPD